MATVTFTFNGVEIKIQCETEDKMENICNKFCSKAQIDINSIYLWFILDNDNLENGD